MKHLLKQIFDLDGKIASGSGVILTQLAITFESMVDAFFVGIAGGLGGLLVKEIFNFFKKKIQSKNEEI